MKPPVLAISLMVASTPLIVAPTYPAPPAQSTAIAAKLKAEAQVRSGQAAKARADASAKAKAETAAKASAAAKLGVRNEIKARVEAAQKTAKTPT